MGVALGPDTNYAKEMRRWEAYHSPFGEPGRPYQFREFPKMLYRAEHVSGQGATITDRRVVDDDVAERRATDQGFHARQEDAIAAVRTQQTEYGKLAAERAYEIAHGRVSEKAAAEVHAAEAAHGARHLPNVPETPIPAVDKAAGDRMRKARAAKAAKAHAAASTAGA